MRTLKRNYLHRVWCCMALSITAVLFSCSKNDPIVVKEEEVIVPSPTPSPEPAPAPTYTVDNITDTYFEVVGQENAPLWGPYNVHDPSIIKVGDTYFCYNTDVSFGSEVRPGIQIRKSKNLINWEFVGWAFNALPSKGSIFIQSQGTPPFNALWAPFVMQVGDEFRLYYSLSSSSPRLSVIGLATAPNPEGPWLEKDLVVTSLADNSIQTNAIDPSVVITPSGEHWFYYGSAWDGLYKLQLDPQTGLPASKGEKGTRIAQRGFTNGHVNGNIEGPEVIYNETQDMYYLFLAYDWLETKYNVRVGRSVSPEGPFLDFNGKDLNTEEDNAPMILAPYKFKGHSGWQGVSHPGVFKDDTGQYYMAHQGRPGENSFFMVLHVREIYWTEDGWPIVSPERYAGLPNIEITVDNIPGTYEYIHFEYSVVPGYAEEQKSPNFQSAIEISIDAEGTLNEDPQTSWSFEEPWLILDWGNSNTEKVYVERGRDWENHIEATLIFSGLSDQGMAVWGKKIN